MRSTPKILIRGVNWLGDAVMSLPAIEAIHRAFPEYQIDVLTPGHLADLYALHPNIHEVISFIHKKSLKNLVSELRLSWSIRKKSYELCFIFPSSFHAALVPFGARIPVRIGYRKNGRSFLLTHAYEMAGDYRQKIHQSRFYLDMIEHFSRMTCACHKNRLSVPEELKIHVFRKLESQGFQGGKMIGLAPGAEYGPAKCWPLTSWHVLISAILRETDCSVVLTGTASDVEAAKFLKGETKKRIIDMTGQTSLQEFLALASLCAVFVANDSGAMHAAAAVGAPIVGIFGSTCPVATSPVSDRYILLYKDLSCSPCFERECPYKHYNCLNEIEPEEVMDALREFI